VVAVLLQDLVYGRPARAVDEAAVNQDDVHCCGDTGCRHSDLSSCARARLALCHSGTPLSRTRRRTPPELCYDVLAQSPPMDALKAIAERRARGAGMSGNFKQPPGGFASRTRRRWTRIGSTSSPRAFLGLSTAPGHAQRSVVTHVSRRARTPGRRVAAQTGNLLEIQES